MTADEFEAEISTLTRPYNGQYPRPWMTDLSDPRAASVFIVGKNQATEYPENRLTHQRHIDALFNRNGESCRLLYDEITGGDSSATRKNTDVFRKMLEEEGVTEVLETNLVCYSTPMSADLRLPRHSGGTEQGTRIFRLLLDCIRPKVLIAHGSGTTKQLSQVLEAELPLPPASYVDPQPIAAGDKKVFILRSLALPEWNKWLTWSERYLRAVARATAREIAKA